MKRYRSLRVLAVPGFLAMAAAASGLPAPAGASLRPTADIVERFTADPLADGRWYASGSWNWEAAGSTVSTGGQAGGTLLWVPAEHFTGTLKMRFRLGSKQARARLLFAHDPATGAHRWAEVTAGSPGRVVLGQTGTIRGAAPGVIQTWRANVATGPWLELGVAVAGDKSVAVSLGGAQLFTAAAAPLAPGLVGFAASAGPVAFDEFTFTAAPDGEPCRECHAGQPEQPEAADVYKWWDGSRWDALNGTDTDGSQQQGGHGDPGGNEYQPGAPPLPVVGCAGAYGCHDLRLPRPEDHRDGVRGGRDQRSANTYHLRAPAIAAAPQNPWDVQVTLDSFCYLQCHKDQNVTNHRHNKDSLPAANVVQLGQHLTRTYGETVPLPVDSDLTTRAPETVPDFAPCVSCHDPHGTGVTDNKGDRNFMLRMGWYRTPALCGACH